METYDTFKQKTPEHLDTNPEVRANYAETTDNAAHLHRLALDNNHWVKTKVAANPNTPKEMLQMLSRDPEPLVKHSAIMTLQQLRGE